MKATIRDSLLAVQDTTNCPILQFVCGGDISSEAIEFYNCCFTHGTGQVPSPMIALEGQGIVTIAYCCFDMDRSSAMHFDESSFQIKYIGGTESDFFGDCECWIPPVVSESDLSPAFETSEEHEESNPSDSYWSSSDTGSEAPEGGGGGGINSGLVAGITVAVLVLIIIIIVVVILLIRRKKYQTSGNEGEGDQEFTEETITTMTDQPTEEHGEWGQTQDNPLFASENFEDDGDAFSNAFEETGFFSEG